MTNFKCNCDPIYSGDVGCFGVMDDEDGLCWGCRESGHVASKIRPLITTDAAHVLSTKYCEIVKEGQACNPDSYQRQTDQRLSALVTESFIGPPPSGAVSVDSSLQDWVTTPNLPRKDFNKRLMKDTNSKPRFSGS